MAEESGQDKTEEPTAQRLSKAREEGQIARSQELAPAAMMVMATLFFTMMGPKKGGKPVGKLAAAIDAAFCTRGHRQRRRELRPRWRVRAARRQPA